MICPAASASPVGSCWIRLYSGLENQRPWCEQPSTPHVQPASRQGKTKEENLEILTSEKSLHSSWNHYVYIPLHLSAPQYVFLLIHVDWEVLVLALLDGIRPGSDSPHLAKLEDNLKKTLVYAIFMSLLRNKLTKPEIPFLKCSGYRDQIIW